MEGEAFQWNLQPEETERKLPHIMTWWMMVKSSGIISFIPHFPTALCCRQHILLIGTETPSSWPRVTQLARGRAGIPPGLLTKSGEEGQELEPRLGVDKGGLFLPSFALSGQIPSFCTSPNLTLLLRSYPGRCIFSSRSKRILISCQKKSIIYEILPQPEQRMIFFKCFLIYYNNKSSKWQKYLN